MTEIMQVDSFIGCVKPALVPSKVIGGETPVDGLGLKQFEALFTEFDCRNYQNLTIQLLILGKCVSWCWWLAGRVSHLGHA